MDPTDELVAYRALVHVQQEYIRELEYYGKWYHDFVEDLPRLRLLIKNPATRDACMRDIVKSPHPAAAPDVLFAELMRLNDAFLPEPIRMCLVYARVHNTRRALDWEQREKIFSYIPSLIWLKCALGKDDAGYPNMYSLHKYIGHPRCIYQQYCTHGSTHDTFCDECYTGLHKRWFVKKEADRMYEIYIPDSCFQRLIDDNSPLQKYIQLWEAKNAYIREHKIRIEYMFIAWRSSW